MQIFPKRKPWHPRGMEETPRDAVRRFRRRALLRTAVYGGLAAGGGATWWWWRGSDRRVVTAGRTVDLRLAHSFPAPRNGRFAVDRPITNQPAVARYNNFFEFTSTKRVWAIVEDWELGDWKVEVSGLVGRPTTLDIDDLNRRFEYEERVYRHRCVETWAMVVPWTGFPLRKLLDYVNPLPQARYVRFTSFDHTQVACAQQDNSYPWPYTEGLTLAEATNELAFLVTGMYGEPLLKQNGAPVRLVVPWKYGYKSAKSLVRIELVSHKPTTFWNTMGPEEYGFTSNVDPSTPHPRWSQEFEYDIGTGERRRTLPYNGYGEWVAQLYSS